MLTPAIRAIGSALPLLVAGVGADHEHGSATADHLALLTHRLYGRSYFHRLSRLVSDKEKACRPQELGRRHRSPTEMADTGIVAAAIRGDSPRLGVRVLVPGSEDAGAVGRDCDGELEVGRRGVIGGV